MLIDTEVSDRFYCLLRKHKKMQTYSHSIDHHICGLLTESSKRGSLSHLSVSNAFSESLSSEFPRGVMYPQSTPISALQEHHIQLLRQFIENMYSSIILTGCISNPV